MKAFCPLIGLFLLLLIHPSTIHTQYNGYNNGFNQAGINGANANGYYPFYYGNGYGFCYVNTPYCCYNYVPPNFLYLLGPLLSQILRSLSLPNLANLFNAFQGISPLAPGFLNGLQASNPPIYNAYNQLANAYGAMDPSMQQMIRQFCAAMLPAFQNAIGAFNSQPTPQFDQTFPQLANFLRSPGMNQFAKDPNPFATQQSQQPNAQMPAATSNQGGQPSAQGSIPSAGQAPQPAQTANGGGTSPGGSAAGGNGLLDGILGAVGSVASAAMQGRK